jgi:hypothetical protein
VVLIRLDGFRRGRATTAFGCAVAHKPILL